MLRGKGGGPGVELSPDCAPISNESRPRLTHTGRSGRRRHLFRPGTPGTQQQEQEPTRRRGTAAGHEPVSQLVRHQNPGRELWPPGNFFFLKLQELEHLGLTRTTSENGLRSGGETAAARGAGKDGGSTAGQQRVRRGDELQHCHGEWCSLERLPLLFWSAGIAGPSRARMDLAVWPSTRPSLRQPLPRVGELWPGARARSASIKAFEAHDTPKNRRLRRAALAPGPRGSTTAQAHRMMQHPGPAPTGIIGERVTGRVLRRLRHRRGLRHCPPAAAHIAPDAPARRPAVRRAPGGVRRAAGVRGLSSSGRAGGRGRRWAAAAQRQWRW